MKNYIIERVLKANEFVGIEITDTIVKVYIPALLRIDNSSNRQERYEILMFLKTLEISIKEVAKEFELNQVKNSQKVWAFDSYLWLIDDFMRNGIYLGREKNYYKDHKGKINWKKTMQNQPIFSHGNLVFNDIISTKMTFLSNSITEIYKYCVNLSVERIGWLFNYKMKLECNLSLDINEMKYHLIKELSSTFDDMKKIRLKYLINIIESLSYDNPYNKNQTYGINNYYYVFEQMIDSMFANVPKKQKKEFYPRAKWKLENGSTQFKTPLRIDSILIENNKTYIIDAKMYQYGIDYDAKYLPDTDSIQKQITYGEYIHNFLKHEFVRNAFILPCNNDKEPFSYIGYACADWRPMHKLKQDYDAIFSFFIDFNYLIKNYRKGHNNYSQIMCEIIEEKIEIEKMLCKLIKVLNIINKQL